MLAVSSSGYYAWRVRPASQRTQANQGLVTEVRAIHAESHHTYGSPRIHAELVARGFSASENRVARLMKTHQIRAQRQSKHKNTTNSHHTYPVAPNPLNQEF